MGASQRNKLTIQKMTSSSHQLLQQQQKSYLVLTLQRQAIILLPHTTGLFDGSHTPCNILSLRSTARIINLPHTSADLQRRQRTNNRQRSLTFVTQPPLRPSLASNTDEQFAHHQQFRDLLRRPLTEHVEMS
jgi:hypothetical protein